MKKFAVFLAGSGVYDGAEIHEATLTLLAIAMAGANRTGYAEYCQGDDEEHVKAKQIFICIPLG